MHHGRSDLRVLLFTQNTFAVLTHASTALAPREPAGQL